MFKEIAIKYIIQEAFKASVSFLKKQKLKISCAEADVENAVSTHLTEVETWSREIRFNDLKEKKLISQVFINVDVSLMPRKHKLNRNEITDEISSSKIFSNLHDHLVILGQPGAGKTTLMKHWCQSVLWDQDFYPNLFKIPILLRLKSLNEISNSTKIKGIIIASLFDLLALRISKIDEKELIDEDNIVKAKLELLKNMFDLINPLIILDGFDEISSDHLRKSVINDFETLSYNLNSTSLVLTCRSSDYNYSIENTRILEICPLNKTQISEFANKWLKSKEVVNDFLKNLNKSPYNDTAIRPLTISHLCAIYERSGKIPDKPKTVYKKIVNLLLEEWDEQRRIKRLSASAYGDFEPDRKLEFLSRIAFEITTKYETSLFTDEMLKQIFNEVYEDFNLKKGTARNVIREIESHNGLIIESGYLQYEFAHKSIHEYLCAEYLVKLPTIPKQLDLLQLLPNELAIAISISSNPSQYFTELILYRFLLNKGNLANIRNNFISAFVNRLILEKPEFNSSERLGYALVVLYTFFRSENSSKEFREYEFGSLPFEFEKFVSMIFKRNKKFEFFENYKIIGQEKSEKNKIIYRLFLKSAIEAMPDNEFPKLLFAHEYFLDLEKV